MAYVSNRKKEELAKAKLEAENNKGFVAKYSLAFGIGSFPLAIAALFLVAEISDSLIYDKQIFDNLDPDTIIAAETANTNNSHFCKEMNDMSKSLNRSLKQKSDNNELYILPIAGCKIETDIVPNHKKNPNESISYGQKMTQLSAR